MNNPVKVNHVCEDFILILDQPSLFSANGNGILVFFSSFSFKYHTYTYKCLISYLF